MVRPSLFLLLFASVSAGLGLQLIADSHTLADALHPALESRVVAPSVDVLPPDVAAAPAADAVPAESDTNAAEVASPTAPSAHTTASAKASTPARRAAAGDPRIARILEFFTGRHHGLAPHELERVARAIATEAKRRNLEVGLVLAVIRIESGGYNFAVSSVGALGLMQIMPATGRELADHEGVEWRGTETLFDPVVNVRLGIRYLQHLAERYDGHIPTALAAYNWGPGRIDGFIRRGSSVPVGYSSAVMQAYAKLGPSRSS